MGPVVGIRRIAGSGRIVELQPVDADSQAVDWIKNRAHKCLPGIALQLPHFIDVPGAAGAKPIDTLALLRGVDDQGGSG